SAAQRQHRRLAMFKSAAERGAQLRRFQEPERRLAVSFEELSDPCPRSRFDQIVAVHKSPSQLPRQLRGDGDSGGAHKSGQGDYRYGGSACHAGSLQGPNAEFKSRNARNITGGAGRQLRLVALEDADGAGEGGEFDFGEAAADRAE